MATFISPRVARLAAAMILTGLFAAGLPSMDSLAAGPITVGDIQACPQFPSPFDTVPLSEDPVVAAEQQFLVDRRYGRYDQATAWALTADPLRSVLLPDPQLFGLDGVINAELATMPIS